MRITLKRVLISIPFIKSPSDTTIYAPGFKTDSQLQVFSQRNDVPVTSKVANNNVPAQLRNVGNNQSDNASNLNVDLEKRISDFIRQIRVDQQQADVIVVDKVNPQVAANFGLGNLDHPNQTQCNETSEVIIQNSITEQQPGSSSQGQGLPGPSGQIEAVDKYANNVVIQARAF